MLQKTKTLVFLSSINFYEYTISSEFAIYIHILKYKKTLTFLQTAAAAPPFGQNQQLSNNPNTVLINSSSNSLMSASVKPSSQPIGAIGTKAPHFQAPSAPQPNPVCISSIY